MLQQKNTLVIIIRGNFFVIFYAKKEKGIKDLMFN